MSNPPDQRPPSLEYAPDAEPGDVYIQRDGDRLLIVLSPLGWKGMRVAMSGIAGIVICWLPLAWFGIRDAAFRWMLAILAGVFWLLSLYLLAYAWHLATRRVRVDIDEFQVHREFVGPFGRWRRTWKVRDINTVLTTLESSNETSFLYHQLYLVTATGRHYVLLDSPDEQIVAKAADAVRQVLGLAAPESREGVVLSRKSRP